MTTSTKYEDSINELSSHDKNKRLKALRFIKNSVIGNKTKKELYIKLGVAQRLVEYLSLPDDTNYDLKMQAVNILGSIAYGKNENVATIVASGAVIPLLDTLELPSENTMQILTERRKLLEASTRALKAICSCSKISKEEIFTPKHIHDIIILLNNTSNFLIRESKGNVSSAEGLSFAMIAEFTARIIANCCDTHEHQSMFKGVIQSLINLLHSGCMKVQEAALGAITTLCRENKEISFILMNSKSAGSSHLKTVDIIVEFVKDQNPNTSLIAATCLTQFYHTEVFQDQLNEIILVVLPALIKLLKDTTERVQEIAPLILADLIKDSEEMQKAAYDAGAIPRLAELLANNHFEEGHKDETVQLGVPGINNVFKSKAKIKEHTLIAIAAATLLKEECRTQAINSKILPHVLSGFESKYTDIRLAACQCAKSLSRSVSLLRTSLVDSDIATPLTKLLYDESSIVQAAACGALCNLVLEFSPVKQQVIEAGAIDRFVGYTQSNDKGLQLNGVWALRSLLCKADLDAKKKVMDVLSYNALFDLLHEPSAVIQEQALEIVRNLVHGQQEDIDWVIKGIGKDDLLDVLESKLQVFSSMEIDDEEYDEDIHTVTLVPALYIVVNMSSNDDRSKADLMGRRNIVNNVIHHLEHSDSSVRVAAVWCIINWTWSNLDEDDEDEDLVMRCYQLRELGVEEILVAMERDINKDVRDRVSIALAQLRSVRE